MIYQIIWESNGLLQLLRGDICNSETC